jgi:hypothetical protein
MSLRAARSLFRCSIVLTLWSLLSAAGQAIAFQVFKVDPYCPDPTVFDTIQDAVDAAAAYDDADHADYVWISDNTDINGYKNQHIVVNDPHTVIIEGGFFDCTDYDPGTDQTTISGAGNGGGPVFDIVGTGHTVYLGNLFIAGAQRGDGDSGGGINFIGSGELDIALTTVVNNHAGYGGGISVSASGGQAVLKLMHDATIYDNEAYHSGGGIRLEGEARLLVLESRVAINGNTAAEFGGGIEILGPARADIGSAGGGFGDGVVAANYAANGGGIAVLDNGNGEAVLRVFADASQQPTPIVENRAATNGGAIYLAGLADACLFSPELGNNVAEEGAAIYYTFYVADGSGNYVTNGGTYINAAPARLSNQCGPEDVAGLGGTTDCYTTQCNSMVGHATRHADNTFSSGAVIYGLKNDLIAKRLRIQGSTVDRVITHLGGNTSVSRCLLTDNYASGELIFSRGTLEEYKSCTIANNSIGSDFLINFDDTTTINLVDDIFDQPGKTTAYTIIVFDAFNVSNVVAADAAGLPTNTNPSVIQGRPTFVDQAGSDYHLRATSLGVDFAPALGGIDLDGAPGSVDLLQIANKFGPSDLGAYELQAAFACDASADAVFCDGFGP